MKQQHSLLSFLRRPQTRVLLIGLILVLALAGSAAAWWLFAPIGLEVHFVEAGQGDAILLRSSEGKVVVIDGSYPNSMMYDYLAAQKVSHIDLMVLTHPHDDHAGGLAEILRKIEVDRLVTNGEPLNSPIYRDFQAAVRESGVRVISAKTGDRLRFGRLTLQVLAPPHLRMGSINNNSLVMRLAVGKVTFLFTGDASHLEEEYLVQSGQPLRADVLKVGHHAADTSSGKPFIESVRPAVAIYSAETGNMHGFPHEAALETLDGAGALIYGTDLNGTIIVITDGKFYTVKTQRGGVREMPAIP